MKGGDGSYLTSLDAIIPERWLDSVLGLSGAGGWGVVGGSGQNS